MLLVSWLFYKHAQKHWTMDVEAHKADLLGIAFIVTGIVALQTVLSRGEIDDWFGAPRIIALTAFGIACNFAFFAWQLSPYNRHPLLHLERGADRGVLSAIVLGTVLGMLLSGSLFLTPQYLRRVESHSALQTGEMLSISALSSIAVFCCVKPLFKALLKFGGRSVIGFALFVQMLSMGLLGHVVTSDTPDYKLWIPLLLNGVFVGMTVPALAVAAFTKVPDKDVSNARALYYGARQLGASLGVTFVVILTDHRGTMHSSRLLEDLFSRNLSAIGLVAGPFSGKQASGLAASLMKQATVLTYADVFYSMAALAAAMLVLLPLLPSSTPSPAPSPQQAAPEPRLASQAAGLPARAL